MIINKNEFETQGHKQQVVWRMRQACKNQELEQALYRPPLK
jgi:hypothetical protein